MAATIEIAKLISAERNPVWNDRPTDGIHLESNGSVLHMTGGPETLGQIAATAYGLFHILGSPETRREAKPIYGALAPLSGTWDVVAANSTIQGQDGNLISGGELRDGEIVVYKEPSGDLRAAKVQAIATDLEFTIHGTIGVTASGATLFRMPPLAERLDNFLEQLPGYANLTLVYNDTNPPKLFGSVEVDRKLIYLGYDSLPGWVDNYGPPAADPGHYYSIFVNRAGQVRFHLSAGASLDLGGDGTVLSISKTGAALRFNLPDSFDLSAPDLQGKLFHYRDDAEPANAGVYRITDYGNVAGLKYCEATSAAGQTQNSATGSIEFFQPMTTPEIYPSINFDKTRAAYYDVLSAPALWRWCGVFLVTSDNRIERIFELGNQWEWKGGEGMDVGFEFAISTELAPPYAWVRDGSIIDRHDDPMLFAKYSYRHGGSGDNFALPADLGLFERFVDYGSGMDPDASSRLARGDGTTGDAPGTMQGHATEEHGHYMGGINRPYGSAGSLTGLSGLASGPDETLTTGSMAAVAQNGSNIPAAGNETRPVNRSKLPLVKRGPRL